MNPYEELGVDKNATDKEIKDAYRKLAKKHHPDIGGDSDEFTLKSRSYALIATDEKRKRFEKEGPNPKPPLRYQAMAHLSKMFLRLIQDTSKKNINELKYNNLIEQMESNIENEKDKVTRDYQTVKNSIEVLEDVLGRIECDNEEDFLSNTVAEEIGGLKRTKEKIRRHLQMLYKCSKMVKSFDYRNDLRPHTSSGGTFDMYTTYTPS